MTRRCSRRSNDSCRIEPEHLGWLFLTTRVFSSFCNLIKHTTPKLDVFIKQKQMEVVTYSGMNGTLAINREIWETKCWIVFCCSDVKVLEKLTRRGVFKHCTFAVLREFSREFLSWCWNDFKFLTAPIEISRHSGCCVCFNLSQWNVFHLCITLTAQRSPFISESHSFFLEILPAAMQCEDEYGKVHLHKL